MFYARVRHILIKWLSDSTLGTGSRTVTMIDTYRR